MHQLGGRGGAPGGKEERGREGGEEEVFKGGEGGRRVCDVDGLEEGMEGGRGEGEEAVPRDVAAATEEELLEDVAAREGGTEATVGETRAVGGVNAGQSGRKGGNGSRQVEVIDEGGRKGERQDVLQPSPTHR
eukprot:evm.model.NODE_22747_length_14333_cov_26.853065.1